LPEEETRPDYRREIEYPFKRVAVEADAFPHTSDEGGVFYGLTIVGDCDKYQYG
jgi:hypothetical protein